MRLEFNDKFKTFVDNIIIFYVFITCIVYELLLIAPFLTFLSKTPFYHVESFLGITGLLLIFIDLFTNKVVLKGNYVNLLFIIVVLSIFSSIRTINIGVKDNLFIIAWALIEFSLMYTLCLRLREEKKAKLIDSLLISLSLIWAFACIYSIYQFVFKIQYWYVVDLRSNDLSLARQGFVENRLFGIFNPLNHATYFSAMLLISMVYKYFCSKKKTRIFYSFTALVFYLHIILSGTRSALIAIIICVMLATILNSKNKYQSKDIKKLIPFLNGIVSVLLCVIMIFFTRCILSKIPRFVADDLGIKVSGSWNGKDKDDILNRKKDLQNNISNNRLRIWDDYLSLYKDIGAIGLSPANYQKYIKKNHENLFIVKYLREKFPEKYRKGTIYHTHNGYLEVFVATGFIGLFILLVFLIMCLKRNIIYIFRENNFTREYICSFCIVTTGLLSALFDREIFFINNVPAFLFWISAGILMKEV